ncbi:retrograde regulation protein 2 [Thozetella sp. PMI_491]|nr:retrograde regulation protein 2 [Thozetella sp. PMI_491]
MEKSDVEKELGKTPSHINGDVVDLADTVDPVVERRLKWKADLILIPTLAMTYLFNSLDRSNLSNAQTAGLSQDLGLVGNQFNLALTYYFIPFCIFGPPAGMLAKQITAKYAIPCMMVGFGAASLATAYVKNFGQLVACRCIVAIFEAGFLTTVVYYLSIWYTRKEIASRIGVFYASLVASSAFGGLISFGVFQMKNTGKPEWFYLFIIEGSLTMFFALVTLAVIPTSIRTAWFLTEEEKNVAEARILADSAQGISNDFAWGEAFNEFKTPHPYVRIIIAITYSTLLNSNNNFLAIIVNRLGFSTVKTNLYTVAPSLVAAVFLVAASFSSDYFNERGIHMAVSLIISIIGYILLIAVDLSNIGLTYFAIFMTTVGAYPMSPINNAWIVSNIPNLNARAATGAVLIAIANTAGLISSNIMISSEAPRYITSCRVNLGAAALCLITSVSYSMWMRWENRRRDRLQNSAGSQPPQTDGVYDMKDLRFRFCP